MSSNSENHTNLGKLGEEIAAHYLEKKKYIILDKNYRFMKGEIDLVAATDREIVFVEVKSRRSTSFGNPEDSIDKRKKSQLFKVAEAWLHERKMDGSPARFDVIAIQNPGKPNESIRHIEGAFWHF